MVRGARQSSFGPPNHLRGSLVEFVQVSAGPEDEHAAVPRVAAGLDITAGGGTVGFLPEGGDAVRAGEAIYRITVLDVTVSGLGPVGDDPQRHQPSGPSGVGGQADRFRESPDVRDDVVGRHHRQDVVLLDGQRGGRRRGSGAPPERFQQGGAVASSDLTEMIDDRRVVGLATHDDGIARPGMAAARSTVSWIMEDFPVNRARGLGCSGRDIGHSRVPKPPARITGMSIVPPTTDH